MKENRLWEVSFCKGIAMLMILLCHATQKFDIPYELKYIPRFGEMGCQMFFILSAFCLSLSFDKHKYSLSSYYKKRFISIAPGYWLTVGVFVVFALLTEGYGGGNFLHINTEPKNILANLGLIHGLVPTEANNKVVKGGWYVGTLVILYLLFPLLKTVYDKNNKKPLLLIAELQLFCFVILAVINYVFPTMSLDNNKFLYFCFLNQLPCFALGIVLYDYYRNKKYIDIKNSLLKSIGFGVFSFLLFFSYMKYSYVFMPLVFGVAFSYLFVYLLKLGAPRHKKLVSNISIVGDNSYPIYLIHPIILYSGVYILNTYYHTNVVIYLLWLPASFALVMAFSYLYNKCINCFTSLVSKIL